MRRPAYSGQFKRDIKLAQKRGKDMDKLKEPMRPHTPKTPRFGRVVNSIRTRKP